MVTEDLASEDCQSRQAVRDIIQQAIAEGRYEPDDDPREVRPHASRKPSQPKPRPPKPARVIGNLAYDDYGDGLTDDTPDITERASYPDPDEVDRDELLRLTRCSDLDYLTESEQDAECG